MLEQHSNCNSMGSGSATTKLLLILPCLPTAQTSLWSPSKILSPASSPSSQWEQNHIPEKQIQPQSDCGATTHCNFTELLFWKKHLTQKKSVSHSCECIKGSTDKQTTPHCGFLFHTNNQDNTVIVHTHRTHLSLSITPQGELKSVDLLLLKHPLKNTV